jgi:hypothetical protein
MSTLTRGGDQIIDAANDMRRDPSVILAAHDPASTWLTKISTFEN